MQAQRALEHGLCAWRVLPSGTHLRKVVSTLPPFWGKVIRYGINSMPPSGKPLREEDLDLWSAVIIPSVWPDI